MNSIIAIIAVTLTFSVYAACVAWTLYHCIKESKSEKED